MNKGRRLRFAATALLIVLGGCETYDRLQNQFLMSFFVASKGSGKGADYGGLTGGTEDRTCRNWTSSGAGSAMVGHHDRADLREGAASKSWNSAHPTTGCSEEALRATGGGGLLYCFAAN